MALPNDPRVLDALGRAQFAAGETNQAIETFNRLAAAEPQSAMPLVRLASVYARRKEPEKAIEVLQRAQKLAPTDPAIGRDLVLGYLMAGKVDDALKQASALQAAAPKSARVHARGRHLCDDEAVDAGRARVPRRAEGRSARSAPR